IDHRLFRRADGHGMVAFDAIADHTAARLISVADSGFPAVYERVTPFATFRVQVAWLIGMTLLNLYAALWRPLASVIRGTRGGLWDSARWSTWLTGTASALNVVFI